MTAAHYTGPNLFLVGAGRAGTTSLWRYLRSHPAIFMSPIKEPHFFSRGGVPGIPCVKDEAGYRAMFAAGADATYRGEASVSYLWDESSPAAIKRAKPDARILVSLREPVDRAFSHYWLYVQLGLERRPFRVAIQEELERNDHPARLPPPYLARGVYAEQVARYLDAFDDVHVLFFEDLVADARQTMREIFAWLEVETSPADELDVVAHNAFRVGRNRPARWAAELVRRYRLARYVPFRLRYAVVAAMTKPHPKPELEPETAALLRRFYAEPNRRLRELLGVSLPWDAAA